MATDLKSAALFKDSRAMRGFNVANDLIGDREALDAAWQRDGYWFFRDILDRDAIARVRKVYLDVLDELGLVEPGCTDAALYNGASLDNYPIKMGGNSASDPLFQRYPRDLLTEDPAVRTVFEMVFGGEVFWVPNSEFHALPPNPRLDGALFNYIHCDGPANKGLPLKVCWIPLAEIDEETGGLALTEGLHQPRMNDFPRPVYGIKASDVPAESWRSTTYNPGDLLVFSLESPHSGLPNRSDRYFRLSMDIRGMKKSDNVPVVGRVAAIDRCAIEIEDRQGNHHIFRIDEDTFCRISRGLQSGIPLKVEEIPELVEIGSQVYIAYDHVTAIFIRPVH